MSLISSCKVINWFITFTILQSTDKNPDLIAEVKVAKGKEDFKVAVPEMGQVVVRNNKKKVNGQAEFLWELQRVDRWDACKRYILYRILYKSRYAKLKTGATSRKCEANGGMENAENKFHFVSLLFGNFKQSWQRPDRRRREVKRRKVGGLWARR